MRQQAQVCRGREGPNQRDPTRPNPTTNPKSTILKLGPQSADETEINGRFFPLYSHPFLHLQPARCRQTFVSWPLCLQSQCVGHCRHKSPRLFHACVLASNNASPAQRGPRAGGMLNRPTPRRLRRSYSLLRSHARLFKGEASATSASRAAEPHPSSRVPSAPSPSASRLGGTHSRRGQSGLAQHWARDWRALAQRILQPHGEKRNCSGAVKRTRAAWLLLAVCRGRRRGDMPEN